MSIREVCISSVFQADADEIWDKLQQLSTLQYIAAPFATFAPLEESKLVWREGQTSSFKFKLFGLVSFGTHTINVLEFDKPTLTVYTNEANKWVPVWNHKIWLERIDDKAVKYTDEVQLDAGWKTIFVYWWSQIFYRHRQKKWRKLLRAYNTK